MKSQQATDHTPAGSLADTEGLGDGRADGMAVGIDQQQHQHRVQQLADKGKHGIGGFLIRLSPVLLKAHQHLSHIAPQQHDLAAPV